MPATYKKIASVTVGSGGAATIAFSSIPSTYTDLIVKLCLRSARSANLDSVRFTFNGSATGYSYRQLYGGAGSGAATTGSATGSSQTSQFLGVFPAASNTASTFGNQELYIPNYTASQNKSTSSDSVAENNAATYFQLDLTAGLWSNTAAITSISFTSENAANFAEFSTATLYGISKS